MSTLDSTLKMGNVITPRDAAGTDGAATTQNIHTDPQNVNLLVSEYCSLNKTECKPYTPPDIAILFNKILWANWATSGWSFKIVPTWGRSLAPNELSSSADLIGKFEMPNKH